MPLDTVVRSRTIIIDGASSATSSVYDISEPFYSSTDAFVIGSVVLVSWLRLSRYSQGSFSFIAGSARSRQRRFGDEEQ